MASSLSLSSSSSSSPSLSSSLSFAATVPIVNKTLNGRIRIISRTSRKIPMTSRKIPSVFSRGKRTCARQRCSSYQQSSTYSFLLKTAEGPTRKASNSFMNAIIKVGKDEKEKKKHHATKREKNPEASRHTVAAAVTVATSRPRIHSAAGVARKHLVPCLCGAQAIERRCPSQLGLLFQQCCRVQLRRKSI